MNWADQVKATALTVAAEHAATPARISVDTPWSWNPHEVWLSRIKQPRAPVALTSISESSTPPRQDPAPHD